MFKKYIPGSVVFVLAFVILTVSVMRCAAVKYAFATSVATNKNTSHVISIPEIEYNLPYPGKVVPGNAFWNLKALRDKVWYMVTSSPLKKAELALLFSDKRLGTSLMLFDSNNLGLGISTLSKGEKYLETADSEVEIAKSEGYDTSAFLSRLAISSLKHRQIIESRILPKVPESARPDVVRIEDYSKNSYKSSRDGLNHNGLTPPIDPFDGI